MTMDERLANLEAKTASIQTTLEFHGKAHDAIGDKVQSIDSKLDTLIVNQAEKAGEAKATKKIAALISAFVSFLVGSAIAYFRS